MREWLKDSGGHPNTAFEVERMEEVWEGVRKKHPSEENRKLETPTKLTALALSLLDKHAQRSAERADKKGIKPEEEQ